MRRAVRTVSYAHAGAPAMQYPFLQRANGLSDFPLGTLHVVSAPPLWCDEDSWNQRALGEAVRSL